MKNKSFTREEVFKIINDWTFVTMKNFSGIDKDFFKNNVQELKEMFDKQTGTGGKK